MTSLGGHWLRFRQWSQHGLIAAYYRDILRPKILKTEPVRGTTDTHCELHAMTCNEDWLNLIWGLKSFYHYSEQRYSLCIHEDGTVSREGIDHLQTHFPEARLIRRSVADERAEFELREFPRSLEFRRSNRLAPKVYDFSWYLESERMLAFDSDLLFFSQPTELLERIGDAGLRKNCFNADCGHAYTVQPREVAARIGHELFPNINSGLGLIHRDSIRVDWCEEFLGLPGILDGHPWRIEQTLIALCSSRFGVEHLPEQYSLYLTKGIGGRVFRHYVGRIRHLMYREGLAHLVKDGFLNRTFSSSKDLSSKETK